MKILLIGKSGQVGYELDRSLRTVGEVIAAGRREADLSDADQLRKLIRETRPDLIVNAAAYTAVDKAESEPALASQINAEAPGIMAEEAFRLGAAIVHYSTDYVFDGQASEPYVEGDVTSPRNVYGESKLAGEKAIAATGVAHLILRTSWVYGMRGSNFLMTMLRLARERTELRIVNDQHGAPTWCRNIADATSHVLAQLSAAPDRGQWWAEKGGIYHLAAQGQTTWNDFGRAIFASARMSRTIEVTPISTREYPTPAIRPAYSALSCEKLQNTFGLRMPHWETALQLCMN